MEREMTEGNRRAAVFLDRDGTINEEVGYLDRMEKLQLIPGAAEAIRLINESGMKAVVVTNQSGVARGIFTESFVAETHARLGEILRAEGASLDGIYYCPHHPTEGRGDYLRVCECRKPAPGLLLRAAAELHLDPARSFMVGDTLKDIEAGARAGAQGILVRTGYGEEAAAELGADEEPQKNGDMMPHRVPIEKTGDHGETGIVRPVHIAGDILAGVQWILRNRKP
jgi:D-glycero-D-manno-heptose 1,7-bisphosphate phosphatase